MNSRTKDSVGKTYRHFKGNTYRVLYIARDSETLEDMVVYQALYGDECLWVRPATQFFSMKEVAGVLVERFSELNEEAHQGDK